jgi:predicted transcriptional regulator
VHRIELLHAFKEADIPTSTYYRTMRGETELRHATAAKVMVAIERLKQIRAAYLAANKLRKYGRKLDRRKIPKAAKSRSIGAQDWVHDEPDS